MNYPFPKFIFDASALITTAKFEAGGKLVVEYVLSHALITIPLEIKSEAIEQGLVRGYLDARELDRLLKAGNIVAVGALPGPPVFEDVLRAYGIEDGDKAIVRLCRSTPDYAHVVVDDRLLYIILNRFGLRPLFLPDLVERMVEEKAVTVEQGQAILNAIRPRYRSGFIEHSLRKLEGSLLA